jgi:hypothetical protein
MCGYFTDRLADNIHDPLHAKAIALSNGDTTVGLVLCDVIAVPAAVVALAKARIRELVGVPPENVLIAGTHTHTGPAIRGALGTPTEEGYGEAIAPKIADAFAMAVRQMRPAQAAFTSGDCAEEVHNRRWHMTDGSVQMNPGYLNPDAVEPAGPTDPQLGLLIVRTPERQPIAALANLGLHYVGANEGTWISADYFAAFGEALQRCAGAEFLAVMANGCFGDINNCDFSKPGRREVHPYSSIERVANVVAAEGWKAWNLLREEDFQSEVDLGAKLAMVPFKARCPSADELAKAKALYEAEEKPDDADWLYARELVLLRDEPTEWEVPLHALRVGDLGLVGLPGEVFTEIGLDIKARSPFAQTMNLGLANDSVGYVATDKALDEGSYETKLCRHVRAPKGTEKLWADTAVRLLGEVR